MTDFERGQWHALNRVLAMLQTYEDKLIRRSVFYHDIMELRPVPDIPLPDDDPKYDHETE